jgi:hypothetical protein
LELFQGWISSEGEGAGEVEVREAATELAAAIRAGQLDDDLPALMEQLQTHVRRKLDIARPGYAD